MDTPQESGHSKEFDIAIVGGGLVGVTMACLLQSLPLRIALIDKGQWQVRPAPLKPGVFDSRVSALTSVSKATLMELGVWEEIAAARCCPYQEMEVWDAEGTGRIHFRASDLDQQELGTIVENSLVLNSLRGRVGGTDNITVYPEQVVDSLGLPAGEDGGPARLLTRSGLAISAGLVIAADGANSPLRQLAGFKTREWDYGQQALVTTVRTEKPHRHTAWQRFMETGPLAFLPLLPAPESEDQHFCSIVWSTLPERAGELLALPEAAFRKELAFSFEHRLGEIEWVDKRFSFPLRQRHATNYVQPGIALIGDAAHTIHPLAGQGVNLGILDARALAAELARGLAAARAPGDLKILRRYQRARIGHNLGMMGVMEGFKQLFSSQVLPVRWLRNMGMSGVDSVPMLKNELARRAMGLDAR